MSNNQLTNNQLTISPVLSNVEGPINQFLSAEVSTKAETNLLINKLTCPEQGRRTTSPVLSGVEGPINYLHRARKNNLFLQNEPNLKQLYEFISAYTTSTYKIFVFKNTPKNEPKRTQNEPNFSPILALFLLNEPNFKANYVKIGKFDSPLRNKILALEHILKGWCAVRNVKNADFLKRTRLVFLWTRKILRQKCTFKRKIFRVHIVSVNCCVNLCESVTKNYSVNPVILSKNISVESACGERSRTMKSMADFIFITFSAFFTHSAVKLYFALFLAGDYCKMAG